MSKDYGHYGFNRSTRVIITYTEDDFVEEAVRGVTKSIRLDQLKGSGFFEGGK